MNMVVGRKTPKLWAVILCAIIAASVAVVLPSAAQEAHAGGAGAEIGMPFTGWWDRFGIAHPSYHGPSANSYADWATDLYQAPGTAVRPRLSGPNLALKVASVGTTCGSAGKTVRIDVHTNNEFVGTVRYGHLADVPVSAGQWISPSTVIGYLSQWSYQAGCWEVTNSGGVHTHFTAYNNRDYACYYDKGSGAYLPEGTGIGIVGGAYGSGGRSQCSQTLPPPPPTYTASFVDQHAFRDAALSKPWDLSQAMPGQEGWLRFRVRNTGTATWSRSGSYPVRLGTQNPQDRSSAFRTSDWYSPNRPTAMSESTVGPGATATFVFKVRVPEGNISAREHFRVVAESMAWFGPTMWRDFQAPRCNALVPTIVGTVGGETIEGTSGADVIAAYGGNDVIRGNGGNDVICGGPGADTILGTSGSNQIFGGSGRDRIFGGAGDDAIFGQGGNDVLDGGPGNDEISGNGGRDTVDFSGSPRGVTVDLLASTDSSPGSATGWGQDRLRGIEDIVGSPHGDILRGNGAANLLVGLAGHDRLAGRGGPDTLIGSKGADILRGGPQRDVCDGRVGSDRADGCEVLRSIP